MFSPQQSPVDRIMAIDRCLSLGNVAELFIVWSENSVSLKRPWRNVHWRQSVGVAGVKFSSVLPRRRWLTVPLTWYQFQHWLAHTLMAHRAVQRRNSPANDYFNVSIETYCFIDSLLSVLSAKPCSVFNPNRLSLILLCALSCAYNYVILCRIITLHHIKNFA